MAGKSTRDILVEDLEKMDEGMKSLAGTKEDIWQDSLVWWLCKAMRDVLLYVIGDIDRRRIKEEHRD